MKKETLEKVKTKAMDYFNPEKTNASRILMKQGVYIDIAGIEWTKEEFEGFSEEEKKYRLGEAYT